MRRFEGKMSLSGGGKMRSAETPGDSRERTYRIHSQSPLKVSAQIADSVLYHVEAGLVSLRRRFPRRRVVASIPVVPGDGEAMGSLLNALSFADVTIVAEDEAGRGSRLVSALQNLGCESVLVRSASEAVVRTKELEQMADILVWIGKSESGA